MNLESDFGTFQKSKTTGAEKGGFEWTVKDQKLQDGRDFIKHLIEVCKADVNFPVQKKTFEEDEDVPKKERDHYHNVDEGGCWLWCMGENDTTVSRGHNGFLNIN